MLELLRLRLNRGWLVYHVQRLGRLLVLRGYGADLMWRRSGRPRTASAFTTDLPEKAARGVMTRDHW